MKQIYKTKNDHLKALDQIEMDAWICLTKPTREEIEQVAYETNIPLKLFLKATDEEESPRLEVMEEASFVVIDVPYHKSHARKICYTTIPLVLLVGKHHIVTLCMEPLSILNDFIEEKISFSTEKKTQFTLQILLIVATLYLNDLKLLNKEIEAKEKVLYKATKNEELTILLDIQKTLVYFIFSLKANEMVLEKLAKGSILTLYEEDQNLLEEALIENQQGIDMANIYREILTSMTDAYATIISNNLNGIMKFLAGITIVLSIPTMIASFLGMNVPLGKLAIHPFSFLLILFLSLLLSFFVAYLLKKRDML